MNAHSFEVLLEMCFCLIRKYRNNVYMLLTCDYGMPLNRRSKMYLGSRKIRQMINKNRNMIFAKFHSVSFDVNLVVVRCKKSCFQKVLYCSHIYTSSHS